MRSTARTFAALGCATAFLLAGCTPGEPGPAPTATGAEPTSTHTPSPTPTPTVTGPIDRSDAALGITFESLPDVTGDARAALDVYTYFEVEFWRSTVEGRVSDAILAVASPEVVQVVQTQVDGNAAVRIGGQSKVRVIEVVADAAAATITTCNDSTGAIVTFADGTTKTGAEAGAEPARVVTGLVKEPGLPWQVTATDNTGEPC